MNIAFDIRRRTVDGSCTAGGSEAVIYEKRRPRGTKNDANAAQDQLKKDIGASQGNLTWDVTS
jgi:hypothetical protein